MFKISFDGERINDGKTKMENMIAIFVFLVFNKYLIIKFIHKIYYLSKFCWFQNTIKQNFLLTTIDILKRFFAIFLLKKSSFSSEKQFKNKEIKWNEKLSL